MSDFLEEKSAMSPHISPVDAPQGGGENSDSEEDEPVVPAIIETSSSDDEDNVDIDGEDDLTQGYVQLAQDDDGLQTAEQWLANTGEEEPPHGNDVVIINSSESSTPSSSLSVDRSAEPEMKQEQVDLIRQVMSRITLPTSAVPEWAKVIPEEKWKASLVSSIKNRTFTEPDSGESN